MRLSMFIAFLFSLISFGFLRHYSWIFFYWFKRRFLDECDEQISENLLCMDEDFEPFLTAWDHVSFVSHLSNASTDIGLDGKDIDFLYFNSQFLNDYPYYYDYLTDVPSDEGMSYWEQGGVIEDAGSGDTGVYNPDYIETSEVEDPYTDFDELLDIEESEDFFISKYEVTLPDIEELDDLFDTYQDYVDVLYNEMVLHRVVEPEYGFRSISVPGSSSIFLESCSNGCEIEEFFDRQKFIRDVTFLPNSFNYNYRYFFELLYVDNCFKFVCSDRVSNFLDKREAFLIFRFLFFNNLVQFFKYYSVSDFFNFKYFLECARELGSVDMIMLYALPRNYFFVFLSIVDSLYYPKIIMKFFSGECEFSFRVRSLDVQKEFFDLCFGLSCGNLVGVCWNLRIFFIFFSIVYVFVFMLDFFFEFFNFLCFFRKVFFDFHSMFTWVSGLTIDSLYNQSIIFFLDLEQVLVELCFLIVEYYFICDEFWFYLYGCHFVVPGFIFSLVEFFFFDVYGTIRFDNF